MENLRELASYSRRLKSVNCLAFSKTSDLLLACNGDYQGRILRTTKLIETVFLIGHTGIINSCSFFHSNSKVITGSSDQTIRVWSISSGTQTEKVTKTIIY